MEGAATANDEETKQPTLIQPHNKEKCPRCESFNTKFCYYNNYSLSQPRYFCKSCRRYWTQGGTLRNVPIGGASRKSSKRPKTIIPPSSSAAALHPSPTGGLFASSCYPAGGGYNLPSLEPIQYSTRGGGGGIYSLIGLSDHNWAHRSFGGDHHNPAWNTINNTINSSSAGNNKNLSTESEINCGNLVPNHHDDHLPLYGHPP